jgi:hypothetical protein
VTRIVSALSNLLLISALSHTSVARDI